MLKPRINWFHSIDLGNGEAVEGQKSFQLLRAEAEIVFKKGVKSRTVLDIGAWDGFFSFEAERRGASRVLATDWYVWRGLNGWASKAGFDYARQALGSNVQSEEVDVFDLDPDKLGQFDTVLFLGVLYHLKDPFGGLEKAAAMTMETLVVETHIDLSNLELPAMRFYLGRELNDDRTNFWGPNIPCLRNMLQEVGFKDIEITKHPLHPHGRVFAHAQR